jgi:L-gulonolactone oxidase
MPTAADHETAISELIDAPTNAQRARRVVELALREPTRSMQARKVVAIRRSLAPSVYAVQREPFELNNLRRPMPFAQRAPRSKIELAMALSEAVARIRTIKAAGGAYAFSNVAVTEGYHVHTRAMRNILTLDTTVLKDPTNKFLCAFEGGATIDDLNVHLWNKKQALINQPGFGKLSFVGAMCCGAHGSGIRLPPLAGAVRSLDLFTVDRHSTVVDKRIEPTDGITDRAKWEAKHPSVELIQDDDTFHAATVSMGTFGLVYAATIATQERFYLREDRIKKTWTQAKAEIPQLLAKTYAQLHSFHIWLNPYRVDNDSHVVISTYRRVNGPAQGQRGFGIEFGGSQIIADLLAWWINTFPDTAPALLDGALDLVQSKNVVMKCTQALDFGPPNDLDVIPAGCAIDVNDTIPACEELIQVMRKRARDHQKYATSPLGIRFVKSSPAFMSPQHERDTCMIECPVLDVTDGARETVRLFIDTLFTKFKARPHWGQNNHYDGTRVKAVYPKFNKFLAAYRVFNTSGLFCNAFTKQAGLDP